MKRPSLASTLAAHAMSKRNGDQSANYHCRRRAFTAKVQAEPWNQLCASVIASCTTSHNAVQITSAKSTPLSKSALTSV